MNKPHFSTVAIVGVGLIGASLGLALKQAGVVGKVLGVGRGKVNLDQALQMGAIDAIVDLEEASTYKNLAWVAGQAQIITQGREDVVGGTVCLVANANGAHEEWMTLKKIARIVQNNDTSWRTE